MCFSAVFVSMVNQIEIQNAKSSMALSAVFVSIATVVETPGNQLASLSAVFVPTVNDLETQQRQPVSPCQLSLSQ